VLVVAITQQGEDACGLKGESKATSCHPGPCGHRRGAQLWGCTDLPDMLWSYSWSKRDVERPGGSSVWGCLPEMAPSIVRWCTQGELPKPSMKQ